MSAILEAKKRDLKAKSKTLLSNSTIPAVVYGPSFESIAIEVDYQSFKRTIANFWQWKIVTISVDWKNIDVIIKSYDLDKVKWTFSHIDFLAVDKNKTIVAKIPVELYWQSEAVRLWGILSQHIFDIKVKCLPSKLPEKFLWNIAKLNTSDDHIYVSDLEWAEWIEVLVDWGQIAAWILVPRSVSAAANATVEAAPAEAKAEDKWAEKKK